MKILRMAFFIVCVAMGSLSVAPTDVQPKKHLLVIGEEKGYRHEAVSHAMATIERLGRASGLWDTTIRTDTEALTKKKLEFNAKNLNDFDAVLFYTGGELEMDASRRPRCSRLFMMMERFYRRTQRHHHVHQAGRNTAR